MNASDHKETFINVIKSFDVAMLATKGGSLHARPMAVAEVTNEGVVVFVSSLESAKIYEIENDPRGFVTFQSSARYVSAIGGIHIDRNRAEIKRLWHETGASGFRRAWTILQSACCGLKSIRANTGIRLARRV